MTISVIQQKLKSYQPKSKQEELNALKEIYQEIALSGLARDNFFKIAAFQGGTALRIVHHLQRFSEDLDFILLKPQKSFKWAHFLEAIKLEFRSFDVHLETRERTNVKGTIQTAFLKEDSFAQILELTHGRHPSDEQKVLIKLEIDTHPPEGSQFEESFLIYPYPFSILVQDLPSLFASKCHAILCRKYNKGRDWFDFLWYLNHKTSVNRSFLKNALYQTGPYEKQDIDLTNHWLQNELAKKISSLDWKETQRDVENFLRQEDRKFVSQWSEELFLSQLHLLRFSST